MPLIPIKFHYATASHDDTRDNPEGKYFIILGIMVCYDSHNCFITSNPVTHKDNNL